ncbi:MAG: C-type lectin domain-containing protein [Proteobacteria bacterium]|jgi:hypothetical protein|nr:C-type lectin domain-containing protein [Pseudomonadota bacterium]
MWDLGHEQVWIGLNDQASDGDFIWSDGSNVDFNAWAEEQPLSSEGDCVVTTPWGWVVESCDDEYAFVCREM